MNWPTLVWTHKIVFLYRCEDNAGVDSACFVQLYSLYGTIYKFCESRWYVWFCSAHPCANTFSLCLYVSAGSGTTGCRYLYNCQQMYALGWYPSIRRAPLPHHRCLLWGGSNAAQPLGVYKSYWLQDYERRWVGDNAGFPVRDKKWSGIWGSGNLKQLKGMQQCTTAKSSFETSGNSWQR